MPVQHVDQVKAGIDGTLGIGAVTSPFWVQGLETGLGLFMLLGGAVLLMLRLMIAWREWRNVKPKPPTDDQL